MDQTKNTENGFNTVEEALEDLRQGKLILVTDDPDRENEGDFICAAEYATTENINFMAVHGKGLICMPMSEAFVEKLKLPQMIMKLHLLYPSTVWIPPLEFPLQSVLLQPCGVWQKMQNRKISEDRAICSRFLQRKTVF